MADTTSGYRNLEYQNAMLLYIEVLLVLALGAWILEILTSRKN